MQEPPTFINTNPLGSYPNIVKWHYYKNKGERKKEEIYALVNINVSSWLVHWKVFPNTVWTIFHASILYANYTEDNITHCIN